MTEFRKNWKIEYKALTVKIRELRWKIKSSGQPEQGEYQYRREMLRRQARVMMESLTMYKEERRKEFASA
jgi:hypothetical protein